MAVPMRLSQEYSGASMGAAVSGAFGARIAYLSALRNQAGVTLRASVSETGDLTHEVRLREIAHEVNAGARSVRSHGAARAVGWEL
jgi:hypothetical protein